MTTNPPTRLQLQTLADLANGELIRVIAADREVAESTVIATAKSARERVLIQFCMTHGSSQLGYTWPSKDFHYAEMAEKLGWLHQDSDGQYSVDKNYGVFAERQMEVLRKLANGVTFSRIAEIHHVSEETIKSQVRVMREKLNAKNVTHLVAVCFGRGILTTSDLTGRIEL